MAGMVIDLTKTQTRISDFPNGRYEAKVIEAEMAIARSSGDPMVKLQWEIHHPDLGNATLRDNLPFNFADKVKAFWLAANDMTEQDFIQAKNENPEELSNVEIDPAHLIGLEMIIEVNEREGTDQNGQPNGRMYKQVNGTGYFPASRTDLITWDVDAPF